MDINEKWIDMAERTVQILPKTLCHILNNPGTYKVFKIFLIIIKLNNLFNNNFVWFFFLRILSQVIFFSEYNS